jgi:hypothetical protein
MYVCMPILSFELLCLKEGKHVLKTRQFLPKSDIGS